MSALFGAASGLVDGNTSLIVANTAVGVVAAVYAFVVTYIIAYVVDRVLGLRVGEEAEYVGLDIVVHGEKYSPPN